MTEHDRSTANKNIAAHFDQVMETAIANDGATIFELITADDIAAIERVCGVVTAFIFIGTSAGMDRRMTSRLVQVVEALAPMADEYHARIPNGESA